MRNIVVGDIHGCIDEFNLLMEKVDYRVGKDRLVLVGDLVDRGPDPAGVIRRARIIGAESVMGNHEEKALRWRKHEAKRAANPDYRNPMQKQHENRLAQWAAVSEDDWRWVESLPPRIQLTSNWWVVHAGCLPGIPVERQEAGILMRTRGVHPTTKKMVALGHADEAVAKNWPELWDGTESIIFGHASVEEPYIHTKVNYGNLVTCIGIDTGCYYGDKLTALILEDAHISFESVQAKKVYHPKKGPLEE